MPVPVLYWQSAARLTRPPACKEWQNTCSHGTVTKTLELLTPLLPVVHLLRNKQPLGCISSQQLASCCMVCLVVDDIPYIHSYDLAMLLCTHCFTAGLLSLSVPEAGLTLPNGNRVIMLPKVMYA